MVDACASSTDSMLALHKPLLDYDSAGGQYSSMEDIFVGLLKGSLCERKAETLSEAEINAMEAEVRCITLMLRIDHRVTESVLSHLLSLLARRFADMNEGTAPLSHSNSFLQVLTIHSLTHFRQW